MSVEYGREIVRIRIHSMMLVIVIAMVTIVAVHGDFVSGNCSSGS